MQKFELQESANPLFDQILLSYQANSAEIFAKAKDLGSRKIKAAEKKMADFFSFKTEFDMHMVEIYKKLCKVRGLFKANIHDVDHPGGVLTNDSQSYLDCLKFDHEKLENLLMSDETHWM